MFDVAELIRPWFEMLHPRRVREASECLPHWGLEVKVKSSCSTHGLTSLHDCSPELCVKGKTRTRTAQDRSGSKPRSGSAPESQVGASFWPYTTKNLHDNSRPLKGPSNIPVANHSSYLSHPAPSKALSFKLSLIVQNLWQIQRLILLYCF
jgi:hypothetical protein